VTATVTVTATPTATATLTATATATATALALALALAVLAPAPAAAQNQDTEADASADSGGGAHAARSSAVRFDVHVNVGWYRFFALGFRVDIPIVPDGLIDGADDELAITVGAEVAWFYRYKGFGVFPVLALQWNFFLGQKWSIFPELGVAFLFGPQRNDYWSTFAAPHVAFGVRYHFSQRNALLARVAWPGGFQIGITF